MSKKLLAVAIAAVLVPAAAMAEESNVTIYGRIDYGFMSRGGTDGGEALAGTTNGSRKGLTGRLNSFEDGIAGGNRLGFRGKEALGNGLKAIYEIEFGFNGDTNGTASNFNRHSWVGLETPYGTVFGGRVDGARYSFTGQYDPFKNQTVGNAGSVFGATSGLGQADRADNAIVYISPEVAPGLKFLGAYTTALFGEEGTGGIGLGVTPGVGGASKNVKTGNSPLWAVAAMYNNGPISLTLDYENLKVTNAGLTGDDLEFHIWVAGASYDFGMVKVSAYYENTRGDDKSTRHLTNNVLGGASNLSSDGQGFLLGLSAPVTTNITLLASYVKGIDDRADNRDIDKFALGAEYAFSKRTYLYATWAKLNVDSGVNAGLTTSARTSAAAISPTGAYGDNGFNLGIAHTF